MKLPEQKIIVSLDVATQKEALELVLMLKDHVGFFKVGLELLNSVGITILPEISKAGGRIFLDGKFKDIPNTVAGASKAVTRLGVAMFNVHTDGGLEMMQAAVKSAEDEASTLKTERPFILGVTVLTSINQEIMNQQLGIPGDIITHVVRRAELAEQAGLDGVIASPQEIEAIRERVSKQMLIVTPGIRPTWAAAHDQKRIMRPSDAVLKGASYLVIGRPIIKPPSEIGTPLNAAKLIAREIEVALEKQEA